MEIKLKYPNTVIHIVDMDTVEAANIPSHSIFTKEDVGKYKIQAIAEKYDYGIIPHNKRVEEMPCDFFRQFDLIFCAVDSLNTRRWINWALFEINAKCIFVEAGCEGKVGHARLFRPIKRGVCIECTLDLYATDEDKLPLCGFPSRLNSAEMCVQWASAINSSFDIGKTVELARSKALELGYNHLLIDKSFCDKVLNRTIPTDAETNRLVAKFAVAEVSEFKGSHVFLNVFEGNMEKHILLPVDTKCMICW